MNNFRVGIYCRLSKDEPNGLMDSTSIENQKKFLIRYANDKRWDIYKIYIDDGYAGTNFDRPKFKEMIEDVENGLLDCILTRDLSRLGRDYIRAGYYTEEFFPLRNVRFIALDDNVDTIDKIDDLAAFKNIMNSWYPKEISKKVRQAKTEMAKSGFFLGSQAPYGYKKSDGDKHKLVPDEYASEIVKRIYDLFLSGDSMRLIAEKFNTENIDSPSFYHSKIVGAEVYDKIKKTWNAGSIQSIITNPVYKGDMVQGKRTTLSYKSKAVKQVPKEDWITVKNTHEPIISEKIWEEAQKKLSEHKPLRIVGNKEVARFSGILTCADCGKHLSSSTKGNAKKETRIYKCSTYNQHGKNVCTSHYVNEGKMVSQIVDDIIFLKTNLEVNKRHFVDCIFSSSDYANSKALTAMTRRKTEIEERLTLIESVSQKAFEKNYEGVITDGMLNSLLSTYSKEKKSLKTELNELVEQGITTKTNTIGINEWIESIEKFQNNLDRQLILKLIDKIIINEKDKEARIQNISIYYKYIGILERTAFL